MLHVKISVNVKKLEEIACFLFYKVGGPRCSWVTFDLTFGDSINKNHIIIKINIFNII